VSLGSRGYATLVAMILELRRAYICSFCERTWSILMSGPLVVDGAGTRLSSLKLPLEDVAFGKHSRDSAYRLLVGGRCIGHARLRISSAPELFPDIQSALVVHGANQRPIARCDAVVEQAGVQQSPGLLSGQNRCLAHFDDVPGPV